MIYDCRVSVKQNSKRFWLVDEASASGDSWNDVSDVVFRLMYRGTEECDKYNEEQEKEKKTVKK